MKRTFLCLAVVFVTLISQPLRADEAGPAEVVQAFYDAYYKQMPANAERAWAGKSPALSKGLRAAYALLLKKAGDEMDWDPILAGNDYPDSGYAATLLVATDYAAIVTLKGRDANWEGGPIIVQVIKVEDHWLINGVNDLVGQSLSAGY